MGFLLERGVLPGVYYALPEGEKVVIRLLFEDFMSVRD